MSLGPNATHVAEYAAVVTRGGSSVTFTGVAAGSILPVAVNRVLATGTTATNIMALA